jgi:hypothetical protein
MMNAEAARRAVAQAHDTTFAQVLDQIDKKINEKVRFGDMSMTYCFTDVAKHLGVDDSVIRYMKNLGYHCSRGNTGIITISWKE